MADVTSDQETPEQMAYRTVEYLMRPEVREELARRAAELDAHFKQLRKAMRPSWEDLHRPFDI